MPCTQEDCWLCELVNIDDGISHAKLKLLDVMLAYAIDGRVSIFMWYNHRKELKSARLARPVTQAALDKIITRIADSQARPAP